MRPESVPLAPELLYVFVFGPGFGESIALRLPPDQWLIVDSLRRQTRADDLNPALGLLQAHQAFAAGLALTHPHDDHGRGFLQLLDRRSPESPIGCVDPDAIPVR